MTLIFFELGDKGAPSWVKVGQVLGSPEQRVEGETFGNYSFNGQFAKAVAKIVHVKYFYKSLEDLTKVSNYIPTLLHKKRFSSILHKQKKDHG